jgi:hypothetical protein
MRKKLLPTGVAALFLATGTAAPDELLAEPDKSVFAAEMAAVCTAKYRLGYDNKGVRFDPPFTEEEISSYCGCTSSTIADLITKDEYAAINFVREAEGNRSLAPRRMPPKLEASLMEKINCVAVEKCKKHLNLGQPEKFQHEQCWKG